MPIERLDPDVQSVIQRFAQSAPVDVRGLANALGLSVKDDHDLGDNISGKIERDWMTDRYVITVNGWHPEVRRRFTVAHEIGHFVLHREKIGDGIWDDALYRVSTKSLNAQQEREANAYAASLLMPAYLVRIAFGEGLRLPGQFAKRFDVSAAVAEIRLRELRLTT